MMNKEEYYKNRCIQLDKKLERLIDNHTKLEDKINDLQKQLEEQVKYNLMLVSDDKGRDYYKNIIDKAIECIKDFEIQAKHINDEIYLDETLSNKLLDILGGKE